MAGACFIHRPVRGLYGPVLSDTVNMFKSRLDKFWQHQDVIYDFKAEIHGTGSRELLLDISISNCILQYKMWA